MFGLWQHVAPTANADELSFDHEAAYFLRMDSQSRKIPRLQNRLGASKCGELPALPKNCLDVTYYSYLFIIMYI